MLIGHQSCPFCPSSDAFYRYEDGHGFCFSCGKYDSGTKTIKSMQQSLDRSSQDTSKSTPFTADHYTSTIPKEPMQWLLKYGITINEIRRYSIVWNPEKETLVFPIKKDNKKYIVTNERYFGSRSKHPKYITRGNKVDNIEVLSCPLSIRKDLIVLCEDFVSAIKIARQFNTLPLLGSTVPAKALFYAYQRFSSLRVWLDMNKAAESLREASRASQYIPDSKSIITNLDPKEYTDEQIRIRVLS